MLDAWQSALLSEIEKLLLSPLGGSVTLRDASRLTAADSVSERMS